MPLVKYVRTRIRKGEWKRAIEGAHLLFRYHPQGLILLWSGGRGTKEQPHNKVKRSRDQQGEQPRGQVYGQSHRPGKKHPDGERRDGRQLKKRNRPLATSVTEGSERNPPVGSVNFGSLRRVTPISRKFGFDRGEPIDRYYIENFLGRYANDIRGHVLEIGDASYTRRFGGKQVAVSDVLHVTEGNPQATIVADLTHADNIASSTFDCIILTQTLQFIYDVHSTVSTIHRILKPGGVLLATFPGISQIAEDQWGDHQYWAFTRVSARRLFEDVFSASNVELESHGNVLTAISLLHGLSTEEMDKTELENRDPAYEVLLTIKAVKPQPSF